MMTQNESSQKWRINAVEVRNFRRVKFVAFDPVRGMNIIAGENSAGKTSFVDAVINALKGGGGGADVIHHGEDKAEVKVTLTDGNDHHLFIEKIHGTNQWSLKVRDGYHGKLIPAPQKVLNEICGTLMDPSEIARDKPQDRIKKVVQMMGLSGALESIEKREKELTQVREAIGHDRRNKKGELEEMKRPSADTPDEPIDTRSLMTKHAELNAMVRKNEQERNTLAAKRADVARGETEMARLDAEIDQVVQFISQCQNEIEKQGKLIEERGATHDRLNNTLCEINDKIAALQKEAEKVSGEINMVANEMHEVERRRSATMAGQRGAKVTVDKATDQRVTISANVQELKGQIAADGPYVNELKDPDLSAIEAQISRASEVNVAVAEKKRWKKVEARYLELDKQWNDVANQIRAECIEAKAGLLESVEWPYPGMGIGDTDITVNGALWENLGSAEQVAVSTAMVFNSNPRLRFAALREAAWMTPKTLAIVNDLANKYDVDVWLEMPGDRDDATLIIEDGAVVEKGSDENN